MNIRFKKRQISFFVKLAVLTILLFGTHSYLLHYFFSGNLFFPLWHIYTFLFVVTYLIYTVINYRHSSGKVEIFNAFMLATFLKMLLAIFFLLPLILSDFENKKPDILNFFALYFIFLAFGVYNTSKLLQNNTEEKQQ